jgi:hypothetical protein
MRLSEGQIGAYERRGYVNVPGLFARDEVGVLRRALRHILDNERHQPELICEKNNDSVRLIYGSDNTSLEVTGEQLIPPVATARVAGAQRSCRESLQSSRTPRLVPPQREIRSGS